MGCSPSSVSTGRPGCAIPAWAMPAMIVIGLWNVGVNLVVYVAALGTVPQDLHDAAALDGAGAGVPGFAT